MRSATLTSLTVKPCRWQTSAMCTAASTVWAEVPPRTAQDTAAATAPAAPMATLVLCVALQALFTCAAKRASFRQSKAMPTGRMRMAAPLVRPPRPASSTEPPAAMLSMACFVLGPSTSSHFSPPRLRHAMMRCASASGSTAPYSMSSSQIRRENAESSVVSPAARPLDMSLSGWPGSNVVT